MSRVIQLLQPESFRSFKGWVSQGNVTPVFVASMQIVNGKTRMLQDVYGKIYPFTNDDRSLFNEIVGYLVAHALGIPQPSCAYIALMKVSDILNNNIDNCLPDDLVSLLQTEQHYPVFCTTKIDKSKTAFDFHGATPSLVREISQWSYFPDTLAMDNTIAHTDRHLNNILRTGKQAYHIIDNGRLVREDSNNWQMTDLDCNKDYTNRLWQFGEIYMSQSWNNIKQNIIKASGEHEEAIQNCLNELNFWIKALYSGRQIDYNAFTDFLIARAKNSELYHARKLGQLL